MSKKKSFRKRGPMSGDMSLNITSMADIFMILLVFLLKGYSTGMSITPTAGLLLPEAHAEKQIVEALKVEVSEKAVQVEGNTVTTLNAFQFARNELRKNGTVSSLSAALEKERKRQLLIAKANSDVKIDPKIVVIADQRTPYGTIKSVLASAAVNGYTDFKLVVVTGD